LSNNDSGKGRPGTPPPVPTQRRATTARPEVVQREPSGPTTRRPIVVREIVFGGVTFRIEHDGHNVTVVLPDGTHVLGTWQEASALAAGLLLDGVRGQR